MQIPNLTGSPQAFHNEVQRYYRENMARIMHLLGDQYGLAQTLVGQPVTIPEPQIPLEWGAFTVAPNISEDAYGMPALTLTPYGDTRHDNVLTRISPLRIAVGLTDEQVIAQTELRLNRWQTLPQRGTAVPDEIARLTALLLTLKG